MKHGMCVSVVLGTLAFSGAAAAQETVGKQGDFAIAIERAFGLYAGHREVERRAGDENFDYTGVELGIRGAAPIPSNQVRLGIDGFVIDHLSLGGGIGFAAYGDDADGVPSLFLIAPRVGYFIGFNDYFGFWPRGGFTFWTEGGTNNDASQVMVTGEAMFTLAPDPHYAFLFGPFFDIGFAGSQENVGAPDDDRRDRLLGISIGMVGFL